MKILIYFNTITNGEMRDVIIFYIENIKYF